MLPLIIQKMNSIHYAIDFPNPIDLNTPLVGVVACPPPRALETFFQSKPSISKPFSFMYVILYVFFNYYMQDHWLKTYR